MRRDEARLLLIGLGWKWKQRRKLMSRPVVVLLLAVLLGYLLAMITMFTSR